MGNEYRFVLDYISGFEYAQEATILVMASDN